MQSKINPPVQPIGWTFIQGQLTHSKVIFVPEYRFSQARKFRFDFAIVDKKVGIEYEGINSDTSRHTSITGYTRDCTKYNLAASLGWRVLRYTALNYKDFETDLNGMI